MPSYLRGRIFAACATPLAAARPSMPAERQARRCKSASRGRAMRRQRVRRHAPVLLLPRDLHYAFSAAITPLIFQPRDSALSIFICCSHLLSSRLPRCLSPHIFMTRHTDAERDIPLFHLSLSPNHYRHSDKPLPSPRYFFVARYHYFHLLAICAMLPAHANHAAISDLPCYLRYA